VPLSRVLARACSLLALLLVGGLAVVGGVSLHGAGVLAVALAGVVAGCLGAGLARERPPLPGRRSAADAAWRAAIGTVATFLVLAGSAVVGGRAAPVLVVGCLGVLGLAWWARRRASAIAPASPAPPPGAAFPPAPPSARRGLHPSGRGTAPSGEPPAAALPPAAGLPVEELSREWRRTAAVLESAGDAATRAQVVRRRGEVLDELERRDPAGFASWLANGASSDDYPVRHLRGDSAAGPGPA
jgi:hypothetical protein